MVSLSNGSGGEVFLLYWEDKGTCSVDLRLSPVGTRIRSEYNEGTGPLEM